MLIEDCIQLGATDSLAEWLPGKPCVMTRHLPWLLETIRIDNPCRVQEKIKDSINEFVEYLAVYSLSKKDMERVFSTLALR